MSAAEALGLPPGVRFDPTGEELVDLYLLPRALGRPPAVPGIIIEEDTATSASHPWKLLKRHRRTDDDEAYFFESIRSGNGNARQARSCGSRWKWVAQKRWPDKDLPCAAATSERVTWGKGSFNLQEGKSGSTGWVMNEYTVASPECQFPVKLCHVAFTGRGKKRQRVPDDDGGEGEGQKLEPQAALPQHKRAAAAPSSVITTATPDQDHGKAREQDQEQQLRDYATSPVGDFWGSDAGFSQKSSVLDPDPDAGSSQQEPFALDQEFAQNQECLTDQSQEQFVNPAGSSIEGFEAYCALLASELGSSQELPVGQSITEEQQVQLQLAPLLGGISRPCCPPTAPAPAEAAYHEDHNQTMDDLPLLTDQESCTTEVSHGSMDDVDDFFRGWGDLDSFCDTTGVQDYDYVAAGTVAGHGG